MTKLTVCGNPFKVGDKVKISGSSGSDGEFLITGVDYGLGTSEVSVSEFRQCPECKKVYMGLHPHSKCRHGIVERIMES